IQICEEKVKRAEKMKIAKDLVKGGISIDIILQTIGLSLNEIQRIRSEVWQGYKIIDIIY
ncbi:MAG: hypothetical protein ACR5LA_13855, partial [Wolbachia sp.]